MKLDAKDRAILEQLQRRARLSMAEIGRRVKLSAPAVSDRVEALEAAGVIRGYRTIIDPAKIGLPISVLVRLRVRDRSYEKVIASVRRIAEITECLRTTGEDCVVLRAHLASVAHMERVLNRLLALGDPTTSIILSSPLENAPIDTSMAVPPGPRPARRRRSPGRRRGISGRTRSR